MITRMGIFGALLLSIGAFGATGPYDESADAHVTLQQGLQQARASSRDRLVVFGASWCKDGRELDTALHGRTSGLIDTRFVVVKIDVGNFDKSLDVVKRNDFPTGTGIPAAIVLTPETSSSMPRAWARSPTRVAWTTPASIISSPRRLLSITSGAIKVGGGAAI
jgi:thioredoxin 1